MAAVAVTALATLVVEYGFDVGPAWSRALELVDYGLAGCFAIDLALVFVRGQGGWRSLHTRWHEYALAALFGLGLLVVAVWGTEENLAGILGFVHVPSAAKLMLALVQLFLLANLLLRALSAQERLLELRLPSEFLLIGSFVALIAAGTLALWLPGSAAGPTSVGLLDAFFTSTSASCVTGLSVRDTGTEFSALGQVAILFLFQTGGLGVITFVAFGSVLATRRFTVPQTVALRDLTNSSSLIDARRFVWQVVLWTLVVEAVGAALMFLGTSGAELTPLEHGFRSVFHAVSAFCNAGFGLDADSLESVRGSWAPNLVVMALILIGGLGMPVTRELLELRVSHLPLLHRWRVMKRIRKEGGRRRLSVQTRLSLWMTVVLVVSGLIGFWLLERDGVLAGLGFGESALASAFQSVTTRTAGFNTVPTGDLSDATLVMMIGLMAVGAGPVSTGGGIKTVTFAVLLLSVRSMVAGRPAVEVMGRSLPRLIVRGALSVFVLYTLTAGGLVLALSVSDVAVPFLDRCFLAVSALSTVGLSTTSVAELSAGGKLLLCFAMFVGRVGPLALVLSVFRTRGAAREYRYPEEELVVG